MKFGLRAAEEAKLAKTIREIKRELKKFLATGRELDRKVKLLKIARNVCNKKCEQLELQLDSIRRRPKDLEVIRSIHMCKRLMDARLAVVARIFERGVRASFQRSMINLEKGKLRSMCQHRLLVESVAMRARMNRKCKVDRYDCYFYCVICGSVKSIIFRSDVIECVKEIHRCVNEVFGLGVPRVILRDNQSEIDSEASIWCLPIDYILKAFKISAGEFEITWPIKKPDNAEW